jgi:dephospho-CoA kinase
MLKVGLTGGIGSGKSVVAKIFTNIGVPVYESDAEAKRLMNENEDLRNHIIQLFGSKSYKDNKLNTKYIASIVFKDKSVLAELNSFVHPAVKKDFAKWLEEHSNHSYVIQESAIIFELGLRRSFDYVIAVDAPEDLRIKRVMQRDNVDEDKVRDRMQMQLSSNEKSLLADYIIINDDKQLLIPQVLILHNKFVSLQAEKK